MEKLLSAQHVADHLGMHIKTLYKLLRENRIALNFVRVHNRMIAFRPSEVERYLSDHEVIRTGDGRKKPRKPSKPKTNGSAEKLEFRYFTDKEAQDFFAGVARDKDGTLLCSPDHWD